MINVVIDATYKANGNKCKLTYAQNSITNFFNPFVWAYTKNGPYTKYLNEQLVNFMFVVDEKRIMILLILILYLMLFYRRQILVETGVVDKNLKDFTVCA